MSTHGGVVCPGPACRPPCAAEWPRLQPRRELRSDSATVQLRTDQ